MYCLQGHHGLGIICVPAFARTFDPIWHHPALRSHRDKPPRWPAIAPRAGQTRSRTCACSAAERLREKHLWSRWFGSLSLMMSPRIVLTENPATDSLRRLPEVREVRDLFARQNLKTGRSGSPDGSAKDGSDSDPVAEFLHTHELQATFQDGREVVALINRQVVRTGQAVDGFELVKVEPFRAIFRQRDLQAVLDLRLQPPGPKTQSGSVSPGTSPANP